MKKSKCILKLLFLTVALSINFISCASVAKKELIPGNLLKKSEKFFKYDKAKKKGGWTNVAFQNKEFGYLRDGDVLVLHTSLMENSEFKTQDGIYSMFQTFTASWESFPFSNVESSVPVNINVKDNVQSFRFDRNYKDCIFTITLTKEEALRLSMEGLLIQGFGFYLNGVTVTKSCDFSYAPAATLEEQYSITHEYHDFVEDYYKNYVGYTLPFIYLSTKNHESVLEKKYYDSIVDVFNCDDYALPKEISSRRAEVKVRGNASAWSENSKPYRIKFNKKQNLLGLHNGKKYKNWVLLRTEDNFGTDYLGFKLAKEIYKTSKFDYYVSDCAYVHVIENEQYKGIYLLCEQNQVNEGRISINENKAKSTDEKTGYLLELDNYAWEDFKDDWAKNHKDIHSDKWKKGWPWKGVEEYHFDLDYKYQDKEVELTDINGFSAPLGNKRVSINKCDVQYSNDSFSIKSDIYSNEQTAFISNYVAGVWDICYNAIEKNKLYKFDDNYNLVDAESFYSSPMEACASVIDLESLCNEIILEELVRDNDVGAGSLYMAIDFTVEKGQKYEKLTFECPWDFSWAYHTISEDLDGGKYWEGKTQYFAGAWQNPFLLQGEVDNGLIYERSNPWFILFNNADWFRKMLREKWECIGVENLKQVGSKAITDTKTAVEEQNRGNMIDYVNFLEQRILYIDNNLWLK